MEKTGAESFDMKKMLADYMENGLLENIIDMFRHDESLYEYVGFLLTDERLRVRIGVTALLETLRKEEPEKVKNALLPLLSLLKDQNPVVRGDAAYLLGIIGDKGTIPSLREVINDEDTNVRLIVTEAIDDIRRTFGPVNTMQQQV
jgi:HEAT repeat protein